jgi:hypothetical protein
MEIHHLSSNMRSSGGFILTNDISVQRGPTGPDGAILCSTPPVSEVYYAQHLGPRILGPSYAS